MSNATNDRWVLVTGATGGLGGALISRLVAEGYGVLAAARDPNAIAAPAGTGRMARLKLDLESPPPREALSEAASAVVGAAGLAGLVNMAGVIVEGPLEAAPVSELRRLFDVNVIGPVLLAQAMLPLLARSRGVIVNVGAISAHLTVPFYGPIAASKSALASLNDAMRLEFARLGVRVALVEPGAMKTGIFTTSRAARDAWLARAPEMERRYRPALAAFDRAFDKAGADNPRVVVEAIVRALESRRPRARVVVGKGAGALLMLARLPIGLSDRMVKNALGLTKELRPAD